MCICGALGFTAPAKQMISKTLLSEAFSTLYWEKEQFSLRGRRHKGRLKNNPRHFRQPVVQQRTPVCSALQCEEQERPLCLLTAEGLATFPRGKPANSQCSTSKGREKMPRCSFRWGRLTNHTVLSLLESVPGWRKQTSSPSEALDFSLGQHVIPVTLPPPHDPPSCSVQGYKKLPGHSKRDLLVVVPRIHLLYPGGIFSLFRQSHQYKIPKMISTVYLKFWFSAICKKWQPIFLELVALSL